MKYYHAKSKLKVACELCGSKVTAVNLDKHMRMPKCKKRLGGEQETFKDIVQKLERVFGSSLCKKSMSLSASYA